MQDKYKSNGVVLIALSREPEKDVKPFLKKNGVSYIVGSGAKATARAYGAGSIPKLFLIDPSGKIAWIGSPSAVESELEKLLDEKPPRKKGFLAEKSAKSAYLAAKKLYNEGKYTKAKKAYEKLLRGYKGTKSAKRAKGRISKMKSNSRIMDIIKKDEAERVSKGWLEIAQVLVMYGDKKDARKYYKRIIRKYPNTSYAKLAREELRLIEDDD